MRRTALQLIATPLLTLLLLTACSKGIEVRTYASRAGGTSFDNGSSVSALADGSAIVAGYFSGTATFGSTTLVSTGNEDVFVARMGPHGTWAWAARANGPSSDIARGVSALADGGAIVTGFFNGTATFGSTTLISSTFDDIFVARINPNGTWTWATRAGGASIDSGRGVSTLADGSAIVTGSFGGTATFGSTTLISTGWDDVFVARVDPSGTWAWATSAGGPSSDYGYSVSALTDGSAIVTGFFNGTATFGSSTLISTGNEDVFVARTNPDGTWAWATRAGGSSSDYGFSVSAFADGSAVVTGFFDGSATFGSTSLTGAGSLDAFVARIDHTGTWAWATSAGGTSSDLGYSVSALADGSVIVAGSFFGEASFGSTSLTGAGFFDLFVARIDASGTWEWAARAGGPFTDMSNAVSALTNGSAIVTGSFTGTATFGDTPVTSAGEADVFVAKIDALGAW
jgi:hypothetical protein